MPQAIRRTTTLTMLDAIAPNRPRFTVITNPAPARNATMALIDRLAADLAANGPVFPNRPKEPRNPYVNHYGKILDPEKAARWDMERTRRTVWEMQRAAEQRHPVRDMPRCEWSGQHHWDADECCMDCGKARQVVR